MSESKRPIGRINAKSKESGNKLNIGTVWPGRFEGSHDLSLGCRTKNDSDEWVTYPVTVIVHTPKGDVKITGGKEGNSFLNYYEEGDRQQKQPAAESYGVSGGDYTPSPLDDFGDSDIPF